MTIKVVLEKANKLLQENNIENYFFEARELLAHVLHKNKEWIMTNFEYEISELENNKFEKLVKTRASGTPFQYILGYQYFMGNKFIVNENVLIPRADTEILVYTVLDMFKTKKNIKVLDMCTGSGCIAISLAKELNEGKVFAVDISKKALDVAKQNCILNETNVDFIKSNLFEKVLEYKFDIIISNPPYISTMEMKTLQKDVLMEPHIALDGGKDGLIFYKKISKEGVKFLKDDGYIVFEIGYNQANDVSAILEELGYKDISVIKDYAGNNRVVMGKK